MAAKETLLEEEASQHSKATPLTADDVRRLWHTEVAASAARSEAALASKKTPSSKNKNLSSGGTTLAKMATPSEAILEARVFEDVAAASNRLIRKHAAVETTPEDDDDNPVDNVNSSNVDNGNSNADNGIGNFAGAGRIIRQRQRLAAIQASEIRFSHGKTKGHFWICGFDNQCYFPDFPVQNLRGCCIS